MKLHVLSFIIWSVILKFCTAQILNTPENVTISDVEKTRFTVSWDSPNPPGSYKVHWIILKSLNDEELLFVNESLSENATETISVDVTELLPGVTYNVTVTAVHNNNSLSSAPSDPEIQTTVPNAVTLSEYDANTTSVTAQWTWSETDDGVAERFNVYCRSGDPTKTTIYVTGDTLYNATCNNVTSGRNVTIVVSSTSGDKTSDNDTIIISAVPATVQNLTETGATNDTFTVEWDKADGDVDFYEISCSEGEPQVQQVSGNIYTASCIGLVPGENYNVTVVANSNGKLGEEQTLNVFTIPSAVQLSEYDATTTSVTAQWTWSEADDGVAELFNVYCESGYPTKTTIYVTVDTLYNATCNNVTPGRNVTIVVSSTSGDKTSDNDTIIISAVPAMIQNLTETSATTNTFTVEWDEADGDVDFYEISCSEGQPDVSGDMYTASCIGLVPGGNYNVKVVANSNGKLGEEQTLNVFTIPSAVQLSEYDATTTSVTAQWTWSEADDGVAEHFNVYCGSGDPTETTIYVTGDTLYNATCNNVTSGRNVTIVVSSTSGDKTSDNDTIIISAVPAMIQNLTETSATTNTFTVEWDEADGDVDFYEISCSEGQPDVSGDMYTASCIGLLPGGNYNVTVVANSNGKLGEEQTLNVFTIPNAVQLSEYDANTTSVTAQWTWSGADDGVAEHFNVYCESGYPTNTTIYVTGETLYNATCNNVTSGRNVTIVVSSTSGDKTSDNDTIIISAVPETVLYLRETSVTNETLTVSWEPPKGDVDFYQISCFENATLQTVEHTNEKTYTAECNKLTPGEEYKIIVTAYSNQKAGEASSITVITTPNNVKLEEGPSTTMSVTAYWRKPSGVFDSFNVSCGEATAYPSYIPYSNDLGNNINASCINVTSGSTQILTVVTISGAETSSDTISLTALPSAVQLSEYDATTTSVTAQWTWLEADDGVAERFNVYCGSGDPTNTTILVTGDTLYNATCSDVTPGGNVTIIVSSTSGDKTSDNDTIIISAVPEIVQNLIEKEATLDTITATWESPIGDVEFYQITCSGGDAKPERLNHISGQDMYNASCVELTSGEDYTLTVIANSNGKQGEVDNVNIFAVPSAVTLREYDATTTSVTAQWTWSEADDGVAEHFNVYCESGYPTNTTIYVTGDTLYNATCNNVTSGRNVTIVVSSTSGDKTSDNDTIIISAVPEAVQNLIEKNTSNETIKVEWEAAEGYVDFYNVYCPEMPSSMIESDEDSENIYSETCTGLTPGTTYIIAVSSNSNEKEGENKSVTVVTIPNSVQLTEESPTTINVTASWLKPSGEVNSFNITCDGDTQASPSYIQSSDISDTDKIEASCINVIPGSTHVLEVTTVSSGKTSSNSISLTALPEKVQNLTKANATTESITASWKAPVGEVDNYNITCSGGDVTEPVVPDDDPLRASCTGLTPGTMYSITVVAKSKENSGQGEEVNIYSIPEKPTNLELMFGKRSVEANWDQPIGGLTSYYVVLSNTDVVQEKYTTDMSVSFEELNPDSDYTVTITTINNEDTSEAVSKSGKTQEAAPPNATDTPPSPVDTQTTTQSFTVQFSSSYFSEENGKIKNYTVIVSEEFAKDEPLEDSNGNFNNWDKAGRGDTIIPYQAFEFKPYFENSESQNRRKKRETTTEDVTIGEIDCRKGKVDYYCNHWLEDDQTYVYKFYACTDGGCTKSPYSGPIKLEKDYTPLIITLSVIGGVLLIIIIVIVALIFRRRSGSGKRDHSGNNNENLLLGNRQSIKSKSHSRPIRLMQFAEHYRAMKSDSEYHFSEEYEEIREVGVNQSKDAAIAPVNRTKNRFTNILPYDHTRVKLAPADDEEGSDYINANYMPGYNSPREFIACQGPLPATEDDMWKLIWEQHVATIVMVTQLTERGRVKCHHYWPFDNNPTYYGDIMVTIEKEHNLPHWTIREFKLEYNSRIRHVRHFSYLAWPDHGVPDSTDTILKFVNNVRRQIPKDGTPTLVHCSAGVGRTGTFICLDRLVQHMREHDYVDIFGIVCEMRMSRNLMVQTEKQYIFIHQCVLAILQGHSNTQNEAIYENGGFSAS